MSIATRTPTTRDICEFLQHASAYPERPQRVTVLETHISWIFLTDHFAYKLKKPVKFDFLDFTTPHARRWACAEEIRLNRRLSHNVYISMLPITYDEDHGLELDGSGDEIDFVIKMRRLPPNRSLDALIRARPVRSAEVDAVANTLVRFYASLPPVVLQPQVHFKRLATHCDANYDVLSKRLRGDRRRAVQRIHGAQRRFLTVYRELLYDRVRDGRVVDGHGDLRAEHVYVEPHPSIIDCVEFSRELREVDVADDLSYLAMDCQRLGDSSIGDRLLEAYGESSGDFPPPPLLAFYKTYRACVRAKVAALRAAQLQGSARRSAARLVPQYLNWADHHSAMLGPPSVLVVCGLSGTGKTTLAAELTRTIAGESLHTDRIRRGMFGPSEEPAEFDSGNYAPTLRRRVYEEMFAHVEGLLDEGRSVVLDGAFLTNDLRRAAIDRARRHGGMPLLVRCRCPRMVAKERIRDRELNGAPDSEARPDFYDRQSQEWEEVDPAIPSVEVDATAAINDQCETVWRALQPVIQESLG